MKKMFFLTCLTFIFSSFVKAQNECIELFPSKVGATLVNKTYDANNELLNTMTYVVQKTTETYYLGGDILIGFNIVDAKGNLIDQGNIDAVCENGTFYLKMMNRGTLPEIMNILGKDTELIGDFLDYPNPFATYEPFARTFKMVDGEFTIQSKKDKEDWVRVRVLNRMFRENEEITTPAGTFDAAKITFNYEVYKHKEKKTTLYQGIEWYAVGAGIVRSETYNADHKQLITYSELTTLKDN